MVSSTPRERQSWGTHLWWGVFNKVLHKVVADPLLHVHSVLHRENKKRIQNENVSKRRS